MAGKTEIIKRIIYVLIVAIIALPLIQQTLHFSYVVPLKGAVAKSDKVDLSLATWFSNEYQAHTEEYINTGFGFRPFFVRLHNQLDYWLFGTINAKSVLVGRDGYLFEYSYIKEYLGKNFLGKNEINNRVALTKEVSDSLAVRGVDLVVLLAAGKASYFPEYFPDSLPPDSKLISNYDYFSKAFDSAGIKNIDFNKWFVSMKDTSYYPLFTKGGIHWSKYGEYLVADSLIRYIEKIRGVSLPYYQVEDIELSETPQYRDNDIGEGMNLIFPHSTTELAYPVLKLIRNEGDDLVKAMVVADSYYWELYNEGLSKDVFNNGQFWYYNKKIYSSEPGWSPTPVDEVDIRFEVEKNDVVFILQTEATLYRYAFGFLEKQRELYSLSDYSPDTLAMQNQELNSIIRNIKSNEKWYSKIAEKAEKRGVSVEEMLKNEARYVLKVKKEKSKQD